MNVQDTPMGEGIWSGRGFWPNTPLSGHNFTPETKPFHLLLRWPSVIVQLCLITGLPTREGTVWQVSNFESDLFTCTNFSLWTVLSSPVYIHDLWTRTPYPTTLRWVCLFTWFVFVNWSNQNDLNREWQRNLQQILQNRQPIFNLYFNIS